MAQLEVFYDFRYLQKVLLIALIVTIRSNSLSVHAISSEDESCKREDGIKACTGENASAFSIMGTQKIMEDTFAIEEKYIGEPEVSLYGVFDGHHGGGKRRIFFFGSYNTIIVKRAAKYTAENLLVKMKKKLKEIRKNIRERNEADYTNNGVINYEKFLKGEIKAFNDGDLQKELEKNNDKSGTTAVIALITEDKLYVANVGNSRAVLADIKGNAIQITEDHKPNQKTEWKRIMASTDSRIVPDNRISRLFIMETGTNIPQYMAVSRSLGDWLLRDEKYGFIADADIFVEEFSEKTSKFIILASNGLWNVVKNEKAVIAYLNEESEEYVAKEAIRNRSADDITIMVIKPSKVRAIHSEDASRIGESGGRSYTSEKVKVFSFIGGRTEMEDTFAMIENIGKPEVSLYGVFDGHGGDRAAKYTAKNLLARMKEKLKNIRQGIAEGEITDYTVDGVIQYEDFLKGEIKAFNDGELQKELERNNDESGTTALIALITENMLYVANVGKSRAVMANKNGEVIQITKDHNPYNTEEKARIEKLPEGRIQPDRVLKLYIYDGKQAHTMTITRSLGDINIRDPAYGFIADAETFAWEFSKKKSEFIILASDGIWSTLTNEFVIQYIKSRIESFHSRQTVAKNLAEEAQARGSTDNITVMIIMP